MKLALLLNVIDPDTPSKLLITTRIRGLVKGAAEVDVGSLSESEALDLLAATAGIDAESWEEEEGAPGRGLALEVVNMCGRLALTVAIAGGGVGGVALALALQHRSIKCVVYERDADASTRKAGYGLPMQQGGRALEHCGVTRHLELLVAVDGPRASHVRAEDRRRRDQLRRASIVGAAAGGCTS